MKHSVSASSKNIQDSLTVFSPNAHARTRILIVDDNLPFLELYSQILREVGYEVLMADGGRDALRIVKNHQPELVILDVNLPDINGIEVCRQIKADAAIRDIFVILISGEAVSAEETTGGLAMGADDYLRKPIGAREFLARIRTMVRLMETTAALRTSEQHYRRLVEILPDAVTLIDTQFRFAGLNQQAVAMLGYANPSELIGRNVFDLVQIEDHARFRADIAGLKTGAVKSAEYAFVKNDGRTIPVEMHASLSTTPNGESLGLVTVSRDATERKSAEEELRRLPRSITEAQEAERLRVARELHDGVNQVIASATMRLRRVQDTLLAQYPAAAEILSRCHKLLVQALEENRRIALNLRPSDLDELGLKAACRRLCDELETRTGLKIKSHFAKFDRPLSADVDLGLFRIVQEALNNVEKHANAKTVSLRISINDETLALKVQDDGRGFSLTKPKTAKGQAGIGLTSLRERAAALGGMCDVVSKPNRGTTITVRVPLGKSLRRKKR